MLELAIALTLYGDNFLRNIGKASKGVEELKAVTSSLKNEDSINSLTRQIKKTTEETKKAEKEFYSLSSILYKTFNPKNLNDFSEKLEDITLKAGAIGGAITLGLRSVVVDAVEFEKGIAEASTLTKENFEKFKKLYSNQLLEISNELGQSKLAVTKAFYDAISSGFDPKKALEIIKVAGESAVAGVSDISTANNTLITVMKAWGLNLNQASDYIFKTIAKGRTTFEEIARDIGGVASTVAAAGIKFKEFSAVVAAATAKGLDTGQTMTSIRDIVNSLIAPTSQAQKAFQQLGITINKETLKQKGLVGTLKEITDAMREAGLTEADQAQMLSEIFGSVEAQKVVNMFVADPDTFVKTLKEFQNVGGETEEAFKKMSQSTAFAFSRLSQAVSSVKISLGALFLPVVKTGADVLSSFAVTVKDLVDNHKTLASIMGWGAGAFGLLATTTAGLAAATAFSAKALSLAVEGFKFYTSAGRTLFEVLKLGIPIVRAFSASLLTNPIFLAASAVALAGFLIYKNWGHLKSFFSDVFKAVKGFLGGIGDLFGKASKIGSDILTAFEGLGKGITKILSKIVVFGKDAFAFLAKAIISYSPYGIVIKEWQKVFKFLSSINLFNAGSKIISTLIEGIKSKFGEVVGTVKDVLSKVRNLLPFSPAKEGPLSDLHKTGIRFVETIAEGIKGDSLISRVSSLAKNLWEIISETPKHVLTIPTTIKELTQPVKLVFSELPKISLPEIVQTVKTAFEIPKLTSAFSLSLAPLISVPGISAASQYPVSHYLSNVQSTQTHSVQSTTHYHINITVNGKVSEEDGVKIAKMVRREIEKYEREKQRKEAKTNYGIGNSYDRS
ncbi:phage tail tape measure protein, TP901 family, core region [Balnearium lithotrophicum]|uniref:Phage tail tape measure protein, TP901 family, core region n=1 Tax=Balnearium lithotrophicum TaxID=223788 RepID=A0A521DS78_9BACT|nr:phage tail tape measure protein [Balnearium lithotrophicum]SMO74603.1 phage tail tape measure protein, TP901 family, core region [Balnearium lithotrophicum]